LTSLCQNINGNYLYIWLKDNEILCSIVKIIKIDYDIIEYMYTEIENNVNDILNTVCKIIYTLNFAFFKLFIHSITL